MVLVLRFKVLTQIKFILDAIFIISARGLAEKCCLN